MRQLVRPHRPGPFLDALLSENRMDEPSSVSVISDSGEVVLSSMLSSDFPRCPPGSDPSLSIRSMERPTRADTHKTAWLTESAAYDRVLAGVDWCLKARHR